MPSGFEKYDTQTLLVTYRNLLGGIDKVAEILTVTDEHNEDHDGCCAFNVAPTDSKGGVPPSQFGSLILMLLQSTATELLHRGVPLPRTKEKR